MFIDTHCHLNMLVKSSFDTLLTDQELAAIEPIVREAHAAGVEKIINIGTSVPESLNSIAIAQRYDGVYATVGLHPCDCSEQWHADFKKIEQLVVQKQKNKIVAIGEIGLDFYHKPFFRSRQEDALKAQLELALEHKLPVVLHVRDAGDELLAVLEPYVADLVGAVFHCFSQQQDYANIVLGWGCYIGIDAPITYPKNEGLREIVRNAPLNKILLETDAPFLPPQQYRGQQNKPVYVPLFAQTVADVKGVDIAVVEEVTTANACKLFTLDL